MNEKKILLSSLLILYSSLLFSQNRKCAVQEVNENEQRRNAYLQTEIERIQRTSVKNGRVAADVVTIPVVVHIIHNNASGQIGGNDNGNISDEQIFSQLKVLNNDFRRKPNTPGFNTNPVGADMELNFELARFTPEGIPTSGIVRVYNPKASYSVFNDNELLSSLSYWDSNRYLNIWVTTLQQNYIGYAEFPTGDFNGLDFEETNAATDGVIIDHEVFGNQIGTAVDGPYTFGRTLTHEIGHWFGLIHTWGDAFCGTDYCEDTPRVAGANNTNSCVPLPSVCDRVSRIPMIENYLDYTPDSCMNTFTQDQKQRVRAIFEISKRRNRLIKSAMLNFEPVDAPELTILTNPGSPADVKLKVVLPDFQNFEIQMYNLAGQLIFTKQFEDFPGLLAPLSEFTQQRGTFIIRLSTQGTVITRKIILL